MSEFEILEQLKKEIEEKRVRLNKLVNGEINKEEVLRFSEELDCLISQYCGLELVAISEKSR